MKFDRSDVRKTYDLYLALSQTCPGGALDPAEQWPSDEELIFFWSNKLIDRDLIGLQTGLVFLPREE